MNRDDGRQTLTVAETAQMLGIGISTTREAIRRGDIPSIRFGRRIVVPTRALDDLLRRAVTGLRDESDLEGR